MDDAGFGIFFQGRNRADRNTVGIDAVHALFFDVGITVRRLIFMLRRTATPYLDNIVGIGVSLALLDQVCSPCGLRAGKLMS
jgi:hypothetical protein